MWDAKIRKMTILIVSKTTADYKNTQLYYEKPWNGKQNVYA